MFDVRTSIGIGEVSSRVTSLGAANGKAFVLSGHAFDKIVGTATRLAITTDHPIGNEGFQVIADYMNAIFKKMTSKQAAVIFEVLKGQNQLAIAKKLKKSKSTIHHHVFSGCWPEIKKLLHYYESMIVQLKIL